MADTEVTNENLADTATEPLTGYELVADMMRRQDEVIVEVDKLNARVEAAIKAITDARKLEAAADSQPEIEPIAKAA